MFLELGIWFSCQKNDVVHGSSGVLWILRARHLVGRSHQPKGSPRKRLVFQHVKKTCSLFSFRAVGEDIEETRMTLLEICWTSQDIPSFKYLLFRSHCEIHLVQDLYVAGYFCHPLRGILSMRETLAEYDFRAWMDPSLSLKQKGLHLAMSAWSCSSSPLPVIKWLYTANGYRWL